MLTTSQASTLKALVVADTTANALLTDGNITGLAFWLNSDAAPDFWVYKTRLTKSEATNATSIDGTTFSWTGTGFIGRSQGERDAWREIWNHELACNPSQLNVRQAFADIFSGATAPAPANRTHLAAVSRRKASRAEKALATGTGSTAAPATMTLEGPLDWATDVVQIRDAT